MTGEMSQADVTEEAWPIHFAIAKEFGGTVRPFDVYQGPYIYIPSKGRVWVCSEDGVFATVYRETTETSSEEFPCYLDNLETALIAARAVLS